MAKCLAQDALVIGGSLTELMTARMLADHFGAVTMVD